MLLRDKVEEPVEVGVLDDVLDAEEAGAELAEDEDLGVVALALPLT